MSKRLETYQLIADILSYTSDVKALENKLDSKVIDWDRIVKVGSNHLVLPAIYCNLISKELGHKIPKDLSIYLSEITSINRNRNKTLIEEIKQIAILFEKESINFVFLKGSALLIKGIYYDYAERMIGDIDILVDQSQILIAQSVLINNGYRQSEKGISYDFVPQKHLPRLVSKTKLAAIELHKKVLNCDTDILSESTILEGKTVVDNLPIPSAEHLFLHNILSHLKDDDGAYFNSISFKNIYDSLLLDKHQIYFDENVITSDLKKYAVLSGTFFNDFKIDNLSFSQRLFRAILIFKTSNPVFGFLWYKILLGLKRIKIYYSRFLLLIFNKSYRKNLYKYKNQVFK